MIDVAFGAAAICPDQGGRGLNTQALRQSQVAGHGVIASPWGIDHGGIALHHVALPGLSPILGAPEGDGLGLTLKGQDEGVDRDVVDPGQLRFQLFAIATARVAEHGDLPLAVAPHGLDGVCQWQLVKGNRG